jgi:hypothetical protein
MVIIVVIILLVSILNRLERLDKALIGVGQVGTLLLVSSRLRFGLTLAIKQQKKK